MTVGIAFIVLSLLVICFYCLQTANKIVLDEINETDEANLSPNTLDLVFQRNGLVDCAHTKLPCVNDRQCQNNCALSAFNYSCNSGFCSVQDPKVNGEASDEINCDPKLGLIKVFVASEFVVKQQCISMYRDLIDDQGQPRPYLCYNGHTYFDLQYYAFHYLTDCSCLSTEQKMIFKQSAFSTVYPVCFSNNLAKMFDTIYERVN
ncbi:PIF-3 [Rachiplusia nu nucleopolyhedrovirus]|uniref:PIF-3 n=1 Tax=Rachiplusia nu nucleopolyhedrovirus TaxID=2605775 RepID=A0AAF1DB60_9ABAC|nr:PIF-3 [Rachiplusia nu nucleopolyhedrovirus]QEI03689.1 PIF-3 [Rachiplusia nu nucleopolyhedrovirus]